MIVCVPSLRMALMLGARWEKLVANEDVLPLLSVALSFNMYFSLGSQLTLLLLILRGLGIRRRECPSFAKCLDFR